MSARTVGTGMGAETNRDLCLDSQCFGLKQEALTIDQKVTQLFEQLRDSVYRYLVVFTGNPAEAEEITQEVFLRLCRSLLDPELFLPRAV